MSDYRDLPSVERVLSQPDLRAAVDDLGPAALTDAVRNELAERRAAIPDGVVNLDSADIARAALSRATLAIRPSLRRVINATGVIIHTNLGRAPLSDDALMAMQDVARGYSNLEYDLEAGQRGDRYRHVEQLLTSLTGAEAAIAVNNNASALMLALATLAVDREVVISRGQLVEIGGGFRIPDVMAQSDAHLVEVGTTNRTYVSDYERAITPSTMGLMRVHTSNFRVVGFVESVEIAALASLAKARDVLLLDDLGSGCLLDTSAYGLATEPTPHASLQAGSDLVFFSGDKLLGGPQAGIIAGRRELVSRIRAHPMARAVRMDKLQTAALAATLAHYARGEATKKIPVWRMIAMPLDEIESRARAWLTGIDGAAAIVDSRSMIGGGSLPEESLPTRALAIESRSGAQLAAMAQSLRAFEPALLARVEHNRLLLDPRTVDPGDDDALIAMLRVLLAKA